MWLLFPFSRRFRLYDHTVFVTYSLSFMMLLLMAGPWWAWSGPPQVASLALVHSADPHVPSTRGAYSLTRWGQLARTTLLAVFSFVAPTFFFVALFGLGLFD